MKSETTASISSLEEFSSTELETLREGQGGEAGGSTMTRLTWRALTALGSVARPAPQLHLALRLLLRCPLPGAVTVTDGVHTAAPLASEVASLFSFTNQKQIHRHRKQAYGH